MNILNNRYRRILVVAFLAIVVIFAYTTGTSAESKDFSPDRVIVKFKEGVLDNSINSALAGAGVQQLKTLRHTGISILQVVDRNKTIKQIIDELQNSGIVEYAEPDYILSINVIPNDPQFGELWGLHNTGQLGGRPDADIDAPEAWDLNTGDPNVVVGVIDTGVDYNHEDLSANMWVNPGETAGNGIDDDGNGYVDDVYGINAITGSGDPFDDNSHGTHVSGTIGAVGDNGIGVAGVNWDVSIMALKFLDAFGYGWTSDAVTCLDYAIMMKNTYGVDIRVTSNSWGGGGFSQALYDAIEASGNAGMLFVAAAGNDSSNNDTNPSYPSSYDLPSIIAVAATDRYDDLAYFSNYGAASVDLGAPGHEILSTTPGNTYATKNGTSMATPHVSGAAVLIWAQNPSYDLNGVKALMLNTVDPLLSLAGKVLSWGRLNIYNALSCVPGNPAVSILSPAEGFSANTGYDTVVSVSLTDCALVITGAAVLVSPTNGDSLFNLPDDGVAPDITADDGIYTANWNPVNPGSTTLNIEASGGFGSITGSVSGEVIDIPFYFYDDQIPYNWIDATRGTNTRIREDDASVEIPIGFDFEFYGVTHNIVRVSSNGYLTFGSNGTEYGNSTIPSTGDPNDLIAPFWDDLNPSAGGDVYYLLEGTAPNRRLTVEWYNVSFYLLTGEVTFEVTLYEGSNELIYQYQDVFFGDSSYDNGASATVGIEEVNGVLGLQYSYNEAVISDRMAILFSYYRVYPPRPDIKANGSDDPLFITIDDSVEITVSLDPRDMSGEISDWWIGASTPYGTYWLDPARNLVLSDSPVSAGQYPLSDLPITSLLTRTLPPGYYICFFILDDNPDGIFGITWDDYVVVNVSSSVLGSQTEDLPDFDSIFQEKIRELTAK